MQILDILEKKRDAHTLSNEELSFFLDEYLANRVQDYQMSAFLMAVFLRGMTDEELYCLTNKMTHSGSLVTLPKSNRFIVDKHSTGGVGDKTSIVLGPLLASLGLGMAKLSGRGLGHTGGTIDKLESIPNFAFSDQANIASELLDKSGIALLTYSESMVPLDKRMYSLRDVTATVPCIPLIASSIMSKKLAVSSDIIILDIKVGNGSFLQDIDQAKLLAEKMMSIGKRAERSVLCVLSRMDQPLGNAIGNANECIEAIETLKGRGPADLVCLVSTLAGIALFISKKVSTQEEGIAKAKDFLQENRALPFLKSFIESNGGDSSVIEDYTLFPQAKYSRSLRAEQDGYLEHIDTHTMGSAAMQLGAGRKTKEDSIDHAVGISCEVKIGDKISKDSVIAQIASNDETVFPEAEKMIRSSLSIGLKPHISKNTIIDIFMEA